MTARKLDAVQMVRAIRDQMWADTKGFSDEELIGFFRERASSLRAEPIRPGSKRKLEPLGQPPRRSPKRASSSL